MRRHVGLIYATNVQRTTRRNVMFYCRVNLCKIPEIQLSVIRKDVTYTISVVSIVTRYKIFVLHNFFIFLRVSKTPFYACIYFFLLQSERVTLVTQILPSSFLRCPKFSNESVTCNSVCESTVAVKIRLKRSSFAFH